MKYYIEKADSHDLLDRVLYDEYGIKEYTLRYNEYGKPYLNDYNLYFNLSDSNEVSALVISDREVGIDIEKITYNELIMKKYFNDVEKSLVMNSENKEFEFTRIWTVKEAYLKCKGTGIIDKLNEIDTSNIESISFIYDNMYVSIVESK